MHVLFPDNKRMVCLRGGLAALCMVIAFTCHAQKDDRLPDSISTSEDHPVPPRDGEPAPPMRDSAAGFPADSAKRDSTVPQVDTAVLRAVPDSTIARYQREKDFAYANDPAYWKVVPSVPSARIGFWMALARLFGSRAFVIILYLLLGGILLFALYKIMTDNNLHLFYRSPRKGSAIAGTDEEIALREEDLDAKIAEALQAKDHRLGVRYLFLKALRMLDERELIRYQAKATNHEYMLQMAPHEKGKDFRFLAGAYEHVWYGDFPLNDQQFDWLNHYFQDFFKTIKSPAS